MYNLTYGTGISPEDKVVCASKVSVATKTATVGKYCTKSNLGRDNTQGYSL